MKLNLAICLVLLLRSWWQQPLGKTYDLRCKNGVMVSDSLRKPRAVDNVLS